MVQNVLEALLVHAHPPDTVEGLVALGITMLRHDLLDHYRHRQDGRRRGGRPARRRPARTGRARGPVEAWDGIDVQRRAHVVQHLVARGKLTDGDVELLERAEGEGYPAIAAELGITDNALRVRAHRKRTVLREGWARYVAYGLSGVAVFFVVAYAINRRPETVGRGASHPTTPSRGRCRRRASAPPSSGRSPPKRATTRGGRTASIASTRRSRSTRAATAIRRSRTSATSHAER